MYRKMGVVFCYNRPSALYFIPITRNEAGEMCAGAPKPLTRYVEAAAAAAAVGSRFR